MRFPDFMVTEKELRAAMASVVVKVVDWTTTIDDRCIPATIGFFVELAYDQGVHNFPSIRTLAHETRFSSDMGMGGSLRSCAHAATFPR